MASAGERQRNRAYFGQLLVVFCPRLGVHRHRLMDGICDFLRVPWIDDDTSVQTLRCTSELGEDQNTLAFLLTSNVFV